MASAREDYLLRMIERAFELLRQLLRRRQEKEFGAAVREADGALDDVLGPLASIAARMDPSTAAQLLRDPERVTLWARILAEKAEALREGGNHPAARATGRRALELALEAWLLEDDQRRLTPPLLALLRESVEMTSAWAAPDELPERFRAALADALRYLPAPPAGENVVQTSDEGGTPRA